MSKKISYLFGFEDGEDCINNYVSFLVAEDLEYFSSGNLLGNFDGDIDVYEDTSITCHSGNCHQSLELKYEYIDSGIFRDEAREKIQNALEVSIRELRYNLKTLGKIRRRGPLLRRKNESAVGRNTEQKWHYSITARKKDTYLNIYKEKGGRR